MQKRSRAALTPMSRDDDGICHARDSLVWFEELRRLVPTN